MSFAVKDAALIQTKALSNGAGATSIDGYDLGHNGAGLGRVLAEIEFEVSAPALTTTELPDTETYTYSIETDDNSSFGSATIVHANIMQQVGAGGAGAAAKTQRFRLPSNVERYVRVKGTKTGTGNVSAKVMTVTPYF